MSGEGHHGRACVDGFVGRRLVRRVNKPGLTRPVLQSCWPGHKVRPNLHIGVTCGTPAAEPVQVALVRHDAGFSCGVDPADVLIGRSLGAQPPPPSLGDRPSGSRRPGDTLLRSNFPKRQPPAAGWTSRLSLRSEVIRRSRDVRVSPG